MTETFDSPDEFLAALRRGIKYGYPSWEILKGLAIFNDIRYRHEETGGIFTRDKTNTTVVSVRCPSIYDHDVRVMCIIKDHVPKEDQDKMTEEIIRIVSEDITKMDSYCTEVLSMSVRMHTVIDKLKDLETRIYSVQREIMSDDQRQVPKTPANSPLAIKEIKM